MPARAKGPRLWLRKERTDRTGTVRKAVWIIRDDNNTQSTGCAAHDIRGAEKALQSYLANKHASEAAKARNRHPSLIPIADVLNFYARTVAPNHVRPHETAQRLAAIADFAGDDMLSAVSGEWCREYASRRPAGAARRELEDLRAAINRHRREGLCSEIVEVLIPPAGVGRDRWLTRDEAAKLIWAAWRYRETQLNNVTNRRPRRHVARFILAGLYTGTRAAAVCGAALKQTEGRGWIDTERGVFYRRPAGKRETKKRQPSVQLPPRILAHLRRWKRLGQDFAVEWNGEAVKSVRKAFAACVKTAKLKDVTPHVLRHTAATWLMQAGTDPWQAAGYLGMTLEMLLERYGHHHPDHLGDATRGFAKHRAQAVAEAVARKAS
jgi:integrase